MTFTNTIANCGIALGGIGMLAGCVSQVVVLPASIILITARFVLPQLGYDHVGGFTVKTIDKKAHLITVSSIFILFGGILGCILVSICKEIKNNKNKSILTYFKYDTSNE